MRNVVSVSTGALVALLAFSPIVMAQTSSAVFPPGWLPCPRCQNQQDRAQARTKYDVDGHPFNPHDLPTVILHVPEEQYVGIPPSIFRHSTLLQDRRIARIEAGSAVMRCDDTAERGDKHEGQSHTK